MLFAEHLKHPLTFEQFRQLVPDEENSYPGLQTSQTLSDEHDWQKSTLQVTHWEPSELTSNDPEHEKQYL